MIKEYHARARDRSHRILFSIINKYVFFFFSAPLLYNTRTGDDWARIYNKYVHGVGRLLSGAAAQQTFVDINLRKLHVKTILRGGYRGDAIVSVTSACTKVKRDRCGRGMPNVIIIRIYVLLYG